MNDQQRPQTPPKWNRWMVIYLLMGNGEFEEALEAVNQALHEKEYSDQPPPDILEIPYPDILEIKVKLLIEHLNRREEAFEIVVQHSEVPKFTEIAQTPEYQQWQRDNSSL
jgi:hypothetical protein